jgi:hypothetical protein
MGLRGGGARRRLLLLLLLEGILLVSRAWTRVSGCKCW